MQWLRQELACGTGMSAQADACCQTVLHSYRSLASSRFFPTAIGLKHSMNMSRNVFNGVQSNSYECIQLYALVQIQMAFGCPIQLLQPSTPKHGKWPTEIAPLCFDKVIQSFFPESVRVGFLSGSSFVN